MPNAEPALYRVRAFTADNRELRARVVSAPSGDAALALCRGIIGRHYASAERLDDASAHDASRCAECGELVAARQPGFCQLHTGKVWHAGCL